MRLNDAVDAVTGEVFRDGWSRVRGSRQGLQASRQKQLVRAAAGHRAAVFKAIRGGGTQTKSQLANQLDYLTTKSTHIVDSSGFLDGKSKLGSQEVKDLTERFAKRWSAGFKPKLGQTTHMLMSYPIGTRGEDVRDITSDVAERFFQTDEGHFDYIIAVHEDRDHPHAHVLLNRRSQEGEFFYLGRDHRFNYDDFRLAMVEEAEKYGVRLEATRRLDRGVIHYPPRTQEVYAAKKEERMPEPRARVGADLDRALQEIANTRKVYHSLAAEASTENREDISDALFRAGEILAKGGKLNLEGGVYMAEEQSFEDLRTRYGEQVERIQGMIAEKPEAERPRLEKSLNDIQSRLAHMQPLGLRSVTLTERPSEGGVYSETNIDAEQLDRLREPEVRAQVDTALQGTGISSGVVIARMETGAQNAALERQWIADDLAQVAQSSDLNLERRSDLETARETLNHAHVQLGTALERAGVLREDGVMEEDSVMTRTVEDQRVADATDRSIVAEISRGVAEQFDRASDEYTHFERVIVERGLIDNDNANSGSGVDLSSAIRELSADLKAERLDATASHRAEVLIRDTLNHYGDRMTRDVGRAYSDRLSAREDAELSGSEGDKVITGIEYEGIQAERDWLSNPLREYVYGTEHLRVEDDEIRRVVEHERAGNLSSPFADADQRLNYREAVERELDSDQIERLRDGDADALTGQIEDRLDRLYAAKTYLQSDAATANSEATRAVVEEIADHEYELNRADLVDGETERGQTHG